jgi:hypothetical protein
MELFCAAALRRLLLTEKRQKQKSYPLKTAGNRLQKAEEICNPTQNAIHGASLQILSGLLWQIG